MDPAPAAVASAADDDVPRQRQEQQEGDLSLAVVAPKRDDADSSSSEEDSSSEDEEREEFAGPVDADRCTLGGAGARGGEAGTLQKLYVFARDARGVRLREGGAYVQAWLQPPRRLGGRAEADGEKEEGVERVEAAVDDAGDGSYSVEFVAPRPGNFDLHVLVNGALVGGAAFPLFYSRGSGAQRALALPAAPSPPSAAAASSRPPPSAASAAPAASQISILGAAAANSDVPFPGDGDAEGLEALSRSVLLAGVHPLVTPEQLTKLCSFAGDVEAAELVGRACPHGICTSGMTYASASRLSADPNAPKSSAVIGAPTHVGGSRFALVRFSASSKNSPHVAAAALDGQTVAGRVVRAEPASATRLVAMRVAASRGLATTGASSSPSPAGAAGGAFERMEAARKAAAAAAAAAAGFAGPEPRGSRKSRREEEAEAKRRAKEEGPQTCPPHATSRNAPTKISAEQSKQAALSRVAALAARLAAGGGGAKGVAATTTATTATGFEKRSSERDSSPPDSEKQHKHEISRQSDHRSGNGNRDEEERGRSRRRDDDGEDERRGHRGSRRSRSRSRERRSRSRSRSRERQRRRR